MSSFEQTMMGWSPQCYITSFVEIGLPVPEKIFEGFYQNLVQNGTVVSEKMYFEFLYVHDLGPRSRNYIDLQYSHTFINLIRYLLLPTLKSLAAIVSEKIHCFHFFP